MKRKLILIYLVILISFFIPTKLTNHSTHDGVGTPVPKTSHTEALGQINNVELASYSQKPITQPTTAAVTPAPTYSGSHVDWMIAAGISPGDFTYVDYIVSHESGWRYTAVNEIGATGLCQSLPGNKMASAGADYLTNPITQLRWCSSYASRYGGWAGSYQKWQSARWW